MAELPGEGDLTAQAFGPDGSDALARPLNPGAGVEGRHVSSMLVTIETVADGEHGSGSSSH